MPAVGQACQGVFQRKLAQPVNQALQVLPWVGVVRGGSWPAAVDLGYQGVGSVQAQIAQVYKVRGRRIRHKWLLLKLVQV